jgi:hypothetical protein
MVCNSRSFRRSKKQVLPEAVTAENLLETIGALIALFCDRNGQPWIAEINLQAPMLGLAVAHTRSRDTDTQELRTWLGGGWRPCV